MMNCRYHGLLKMEHHSQARTTFQTPSGCITCNAIREKKCPGVPSGAAPCDECARLHIECLPVAGGHSGDVLPSHNRESIVRCRDKIKNWTSSSEPRIPDAVLQLSNILSDLSIGMSSAPWPAIRKDQNNSELDNHLESEPATIPERSSPSEHQTRIHPGMLHAAANSASTASHDAVNSVSYGGSTGAYQPLSQSSLTDIMRDVAVNPQTNRSGSASSGVPSSTPYETYHNLDAPVRFILPIASFLLTSYLPQIREMVLIVDDDDDDKAALRDAVAREAADLPGDLCFGVAS